MKKMQKTLRLVLIVILFTVFFGACDNSGSTSSAKKIIASGYVEKSSNTIVLDESSMELIESINDDGTILFSEISEQLESAESGDVLVISSCANVPNGALKMIDRINGTTVTTTQAKFEDAIANADIEMNTTMVRSDIDTFKALKNGVSLDEASDLKLRSLLWQVDTITINMNNTVLVDADGNLSTTYDQLSVSGAITIEPEFEVDLKMRWFKVSEFLFRNRTKETVEVTLKNGGIDSPAYSFDKSWEIAKFAFSPIVFTVSGFPIVLTPVLVVKIGINGEISYEISTTLRQTADLELGACYKDNKWTPIKNLSLGFGVVSPSVESEASMSITAGPEFDLLLYGIAGPYVDALGCIKFELDGEITNSLITTVDFPGMEYDGYGFDGTLEGYFHWQIYGGISSHLGVKLSLLTSVLDYNVELFSWEKMIHEGLISGSLMYDENGFVDSDYVLDL